jgi:signal transduction histidine kinase/ligand-binding sensor domain-containing protein/DNA-binding response OmpR family regulator
MTNIFKTKYGLFLLSGLFLWISEITYAQSNRFIFEHYSAKNGLIHDLIEYVYIDSEGYVWLAQINGLQQFDGFDFVKYSFTPGDSNAISDNFITSIYEDHIGNIWIGTFSNGLEMFDKKKEVFHHFRHDPKNHNTISSNNIPRGKKVITQDKFGNLWVNTDHGLNKINLSTKAIDRFYGDFEGQLLYDSSEHVLWIAYKKLKKFNLSDYKLETFEVKQITENNAIITSILIDQSGLLWLGSGSGLTVFNKSENEILSADQYLTSANAFFQDYEWTHNPIKSLYRDYRGYIWMGMEESLYRLNPADGTFRIFKHETGNQSSLIDGEITGVYGSRKGVIWITYLNKGISKVNIQTKKFDHYKHDPNNQNSLSGNTVRSVFLDRKGHLWVGTYNNGLNRLKDQKAADIVYYMHEPGNDRSLSSNYITSAFVDSRDRLWVGTFENGLCYADNIYESEELSFNRFKTEDTFEVHEFTEDENGRIWISTQKGFYIFDPVTKNFNRYGSSPNQLSLVKEINIQSIYIEPPNIFWLATWNKGLCKLVINSDSLLHSVTGRDSIVIYDRIMDLDHSIIDNRFINIYSDRKGNIWLGSNANGLIKVIEDNDSLNFIKYDMNKGAPDNSVFGIAGDKDGNIWISTGNGIGKFDPETENFINYHESDGLQSNVFMWDASFQSPDDKIFFGGINGLNAFYPDSIIDNQSKAKVFISKLIIHNKEVQIGDEINGRQILNKSIRFADKIVLTSNEPVFSLEFIALDNINPKENIYAYQLEGFDNDWNYAASNRRYVTYTNLDPDEYVFKVKATNSDGYWNEEPASLIIVIKPPVWKTWWAYIMYIVAFLGLLYLLQWEILKFDRLKHKLQLEELRHEKDNELSTLKLNFFTNLSHEFRTPLTLILGPVQSLLNTNETSNRVRHQLEIVDKNAKRLLKITNQLLKFRKQDFDKLQIKAAKGNIVKFIQEIALAFRHHAQLRQIDFSCHFQDKKILIWFDRDKMEIVLFNILSNAFKFTQQKGKIDILVKKSNGQQDVVKVPDGYASAAFGQLPDTCNEWVEIRVKDNGCGISTDHINNIFKRYYQVNQSDFENLSGSGIGLEQIKNYVELHYGKIMVISREGAGTEFIFCLPVGSRHLKESEKDHKFKNSEHTDHYRLPSDLKISIEQNALETQQKDYMNDDQPEILIIDDNPDIIIYLKEILKSEYSIIDASDGVQGFSLAVEKMPDLIISDIMMPGMDGLQLCVKLKTDIKTSHIPVTLLTARTSMIYQIEGLETGADDYITKPFDERTLKARIRNLIASRKKFRELFSQEFIIKPKDITITTPDERFLDQVIRIIEENISDPEYNVEKLSRDVGMSHSMMYKKIVALTDLNIVEFIKRIKLQRAAQILTQSKISISDVSYEVGFTDPKYFSKCFQKQFMVTPTEFIAKTNKSQITN